MMTRYLFPVLVLIQLFPINLVSQEIKTEYYNTKWQIVHDTSFTTKRVYYSQDSLYVIKDYYKNDKLIMYGEYISIEPQVEHGKFMFYDEKTGKLKAEGAYKNGELYGIWNFYKTNNKIDYKVNYSYDTLYCEFNKDKIETKYNNNSKYVYNESTDKKMNNTLMRQFTQENLLYPILAQKYGKSGNAFVILKINKDGYICDILVAGNTYKDLKSEARRVALTAPKWDINSLVFHGDYAMYTYPVRFKIE